MIQVKFFSSLRELTGFADAELPYSASLTINDVWLKTSPEQPLPANTLCAINMEYAKFDDPVQDNDEVAFFPPVTGG